MTAQRKVLDQLSATEGLSAAEIAHCVGLSIAQTAAHLVRLRRKGLAVSGIAVGMSGNGIDRGEMVWHRSAKAEQGDA